MEGSNPSATNPVPAPNEESASNSSSLTLSLTPPLSDAPKDETSTISEHLSSIENDRSMQEIEVGNFTENFTLLLNLAESERISQEPKPPTLNSSFNSNSIISLNGLERLISTNMEGRNNAMSILEEILSNDQFKSEPESKEESLDIFANIDLDDKLINSYNVGKSANFNLSKNDSINSYDEVCKRVKDFEELIAVKDTTIAALTSELDSFRELISNTSSLGTSTTEYKQYQDECHNKLVEYHDALAHKDDQIEKLTTTLQQSILNREEMKQHFKNEIGQLQEQLETTSKLLKEHKCGQKCFDFDDQCRKLESVLEPSQIALFNDVKMALQQHIDDKKSRFEEEIAALKSKIDADKLANEAEMARLNELVASVKDSSSEVLELKQELDAKHSKEMEELRTYFEKKCADMEKNYSEEVFSQQSRKMSGSSSCSEMELSSDFVVNPGPGGDTRMDYTKKDVVKMHQTMTQILALMNNYDLNDLSEDDFHRLREEIARFDLRSLLKYDLSTMRSELQNKYHAELEILREDFDNRVDVMNVEHESKLRSLEKRYLEEIEDLNAQLRGRIVTTAQQEVRLVASENIDEDWPDELLQLKERFAEKYRQEIDRLRREHQEEIARLKEEHAKNVERTRRRSLRDADTLSRGDIELLRERDCLKRQTLALRNLLGELLKYFTQCEDELNNTLVEELISKNLSRIEEEATSPRDSLNNGNVKRVHLTPNFDDLINLIDNSQDNDLESIDLKSELGSCLRKLKADANAILALTADLRPPDEKIKATGPKDLEREVSSLTRKLIGEAQLRNELAEELNEARSVVQSLESDRNALETQLEEVLERQKIVEGDLTKAREKIAELIENGHGEIVSEGYGEDGHKSVRGLAEAVVALTELQERARNMLETPARFDSNVVHLIEDLSRMGGKIVEEARRDKDDLKQQVENLEQQLREMSRLMEATERRCKEVESERQEAVDKIFELRDIIRELEEQVKVKAHTEEELRDIVGELEVIVKHQVNDELREVSETRRDVSDIEQLHRYIGSLEGEVQKLRLSSEIAGSEGAIQQIKNHLCDFETTLDKRTKDLEGLHSSVSATACSSPSEDMSIRDVVHQDRSVYDECEVPLQQLARLREKLLRHSRAEDAAVKRIRDLEMQMAALKAELEESQNEREILKKQISEHLVLISNLQIRLDEQRIRAEHIEKQTNTSLEVQNYDLKHTIASLEEQIVKRDRAIAQLKNNIEETKRRLEDREKELSSTRNDEIIAQMQEQVEFLRGENLKLKTKLDKEAQILPNLVENIISDKNSDIEMLREKLVETERQLELFTSLNLDLEEIEQVRRMKSRSESLVVSPNPPERKSNETVLLESEPEISTIEKIGPPNLFLSLQQVPNQKANSTEKHVRFEDEVDDNRLRQLEKVVAEKDEAIRRYEDRLQSLQDLEEKIGQLQNNMEATENHLKQATQTFEEEQKKNEGTIEEIRQELATKQSQLSQKEEELEACREDLEEERKRHHDDLKTAQKLRTELRARDEELRSHEETLKIQNEELKKLQEEVVDLKQHQETILREKESVIGQLKIQMEDLKKELAHLQHLLVEKEKIIDQMGADSRSLHVNLETIQSKLQESGNVVDLGRRLREEQKKNSALYEELHALKAQLLGVDRRSIEDITGQVQRELDYSAYLDSTLINAVGDGSLEGEDVEALKLALKKQKSVNKQLVRAKELAEKKLEDLERRHEEVRKELDTVQYEDAMLIGQLRNKLESAADSHVTFNRILEAGKSERSELETKLKSMKHQMSSLPDFRTEKRGLSMRIQLLEEENNDLKQKVKGHESTRLDLELREDEIQKLETKIAAMAYNELALKDKVARLKTELESKTLELTTAKRSADEADSQRRKLQRQLDHRSRSSDVLPDKLMEKIRELNDVVKDNVKMVDLISRLNHEKTVLEDRISALEGNRPDLPFDDPASRANYLFAKYLRSESYRKALMWQKRYLISLLETYQAGDVVVEVEGAPPRRKSRCKLKTVALVVISVCRMKYLVRRWHSGKRIAQQRAVGVQRAQFQVGHPVSSQNFASSALSQPKSEMPWFGTSPPSKEAKPQPPTFQKKPSTSQSRESLASPAMLSKYMERFNQIQERLGLDSYH